MKKNTHILFMILFVIVSFSCNKKHLELSNPNALSADNYFGSEKQLKATVDAIYSSMQSQGLFGRYYQYIYDNLGHENTALAALSGDLRDFLNYTFTPSNNDIYLYWKNCYNGIARANFVIQNESKISGVSNTLKDKYIGEAKFLRAYYYFLLTSRFGDIPLYTTTNIDPKGQPRSPSAQVYDLIYSDLESAGKVLRQKSKEEAGRITAGAAYALLGKIKLYNKQYLDAKKAFDNILASEYKLVDNYFDNFKIETENNGESVFEVKLEDQGFAYTGWDGQDKGLTEATWRGIEYGFKGWHNVDPTQNLLNEFESGDPRYGASFYSLGDNYGANNNLLVTQTNLGTSKAVWKKYQQVYRLDAETFFSGINHRIIRYADVILMRAEVENELGNLSTAIDLLNIVRDRAKMPRYGTEIMNPKFPVSNKAEVMKAVMHERRVELAGEQSRYNDLIRWGNIQSEIPEFKAGKHELWPIPQNEINTNFYIDNKDQNPGY